MPHFVSGIYSEYYATKYPDEITAIIMLDTTSSAKTDTNIPKFVLELSKVQEAIGLGRIFNSIVVTSVLSINHENGYTQKEINDYTKFMNHVNNETIFYQIYQLNENILEVMKMEFPNEVQVLKLISSETLKK